MTSYWGIRTSKEKHDLIGEHLANGLLRQGWGSRDLRIIGQEVASGEADQDARSIWKYTQRMLDVDIGDVVLTPHQPAWNRNGVWRVIGRYEFDPLPDAWEGYPDFGHVLRVEPLGVIDHRSASVSSSLRRALTSGFRARMRQLQDYGDEIERLLGDPAAVEASDAAGHFEAVREQAREALGEALLRQYGNADFEQPIGALLNVLYPDAVTHTAGPREHGRDFVIEDVDRLGLTRTVIVQVKSWRGELDEGALRHGLGQLDRGITAHGGGVDMAVLLTLADDLPPDADKAIAVAQDRAGVPMRVLLKDETLDLMLSQIAHMDLSAPLSAAM
jgi:hypothetical protein